MRNIIRTAIIVPSWIMILAAAFLVGKVEGEANVRMPSGLMTESSVVQPNKAIQTKTVAKEQKIAVSSKSGQQKPSQLKAIAVRQKLAAPKIDKKTTAKTAPQSVGFDRNKSFRSDIPSLAQARVGNDQVSLSIYCSAMGGDSSKVVFANGAWSGCPQAPMTNPDLVCYNIYGNDYHARTDGNGGFRCKPN